MEDGVGVFCGGPKSLRTVGASCRRWLTRQTGSVPEGKLRFEIPCGNGIWGWCFLRRPIKLTNRRRHLPPLATKQTGSIPEGKLRLEIPCGNGGWGRCFLRRPIKLTNRRRHLPPLVNETNGLRSRRETYSSHSRLYEKTRRKRANVNRLRSVGILGVSAQRSLEKGFSPVLQSVCHRKQYK